MKKLSTEIMVVVGWILVTGLFAGAAYHLGYMDGRSDLDAWLRDNNVYRFKTIEK